MSNRFPPGHPLAVHPGLPPHPLDSVPGALPHGHAPLTARDHEAHAQRLLRQQLRMDPRLVPLQSRQGHDLPESPADAIGGVHLEGHSDLPEQQIGAGVPADREMFEGRDRKIVSPFNIVTPYASRGSTVTLGVGNVVTGSAASGAFILNPYVQTSGQKLQVAECKLGEDDCAAFSVIFQVTQPPTIFPGVPNQQDADTAVIVGWEIQYGYGGVTFVRNVWENQGRIVVVGNFCRISAFLISTGRSVLPRVQNTVTAQASAMIVPCIDGQLRSTTAWAPFTSINPISGIGTGFVNLFQGPCTLWRIGGFLSATTGGNADFLALYDFNLATGATPGNGTPIGSQIGGKSCPLIIGEVPQGSEFSVDLSTSGFDFTQGIFIAASTTSNTLTLDTIAAFAGDIELLVN